ncbi:MAG: hypothetical protein M1830_004629 [Pleopsidium flavum]|nr:MAG: hypothetical protein M1830_004629 [Pleopsidium flavum]
MLGPDLDSAHSRNTFEDLSGVPVSASSNPYDALIHASANEPAHLQARYNTHRLTRTDQQRTQLLDPAFPGVIVDPILQRLEDPSLDVGYVDPRHCLVFWARPPSGLRELISNIQQKLRSVAPKLWLMPVDNLHMTTLEVTHSLSNEEINRLADTLSPKIPEITEYTFDHRARLIKPLLSYDGAAIAVSFLPAAGEGLHGNRTLADDGYTYHHLRRDLYEICKSSGVAVASRYTVPSAHLTIGRFVTQEDFSKAAQDGTSIPDREKMKKWIDVIEDLNLWLQEEYWPNRGKAIGPGGEWIVGMEKGLDCRRGTLWYGGGETVRLGKGF